jgi:hypothetical protein
MVIAFVLALVATYWALSDDAAVAASAALVALVALFGPLTMRVYRRKT